MADKDIFNSDGSSRGYTIGNKYYENGELKAYVQDNRIYSSDGQNLGYINDGKLYSNNGEYLGHETDDKYYDSDNTKRGYSINRPGTPTDDYTSDADIDVDDDESFSTPTSTSSDYYGYDTGSSHHSDTFIEKLCHSISEFLSDALGLLLIILACGGGPILIVIIVCLYLAFK